MIKRTIFIILSLFVIIVSTKAQTWTQVGQDLIGEEENDLFGKSVSISADGTILAVGSVNNDGGDYAAGSVKVFQINEGLWEQLGEDIDGNGYGHFGYSVSLSSDGTIFAAGAPEQGDMGYMAGQVRVFRYVENIWLQIGEDLNPETAGNQSGWSVSLNSDGTILAVSAISNDDYQTAAGQVKVFQNFDDQWIQIGNDLYGNEEFSRFGYSVCLNEDGTIIAVGAVNNNTGFGYLTAYKYNNETWEQLGDDINSEDGDDMFGYSVSMNADGSVMAAGAKWNDGNGNASGHTRVFQYIEEAWEQIGEDIDGEYPGDVSGWSVGLNSSGTVLAVGAIGSYVNGSNVGQVRIFKNSSGTWEQISGDIDGQDVGENFGSAVDLNNDGSVVAIGAYRSYSSGDDPGLARVYYCPIPVISLQPESEQIADHGIDFVFTLEAEGNNLSYRWKKDGEFLSDDGHISGAYTNELTLFSVNGNDEGIYNCVVTGNCGDVISADATLSVITDVNDLQGNNILIYPTLTEKFVNISNPKNNIQYIIITDIAGKELFRKYGVQEFETFDLSGISNGIYLICIHSENKIFTSKLIKR